MEFQFGTNWAGFSKYAGAVIGQTLAMEGMFAFFLESAFIGALIWGEKRLGPRNHFPGGGRSRYRQLAFRFFYPGHKRFHATSDWLHGRAEWLACII